MTIPNNALSIMINNTRGIASSNLRSIADEKFVPLTIEELIMQCQQTMQSLDTQLRTKMNDQKARNGSLAALGELSNIVSSAPKGDLSGLDDDGVGAKGQNAALDAKDTNDPNAKSLNDRLNDLEREHPELKAEIDAARAKMANGLSEQEAKECTTMIDTKSDALRNDNETSMISIQSIVSKRSQALQMTSNLVNSMNESAKALVQNIR